MLNWYQPTKKNIFVVIIFIFLSAVMIPITITEPLIGLGMLSSFLLVILSLIRPAWLFTFIYPALLPIGQIPVSVGSMSFSLERILVILGGIGVLGGIFVTKNIKLKKVPANVFLGVFLWLAAYVISGWMSPAPDGPVILFGYLQKIILAYMVYISITTPQGLSLAPRAYLVSGIVASLFALIAYFEYGNLSVIRQASYYGGSTLAESVFLGLARAGTGNAMFVWLALWLFQNSESKKGQAFWGILILWFGVINLFALRRELLLTIPLGLLFLGWRNMLGSRPKVVFISVFLILLGIWFVNSSPEWQQRLLNESADQFSSAQDPRLNMLFKFTPIAFIHAPWLGYGPGNYAATQFLFPETVSPQILAFGGSPPHNVWSSTLVEAGFFSLLGLCLFLFELGKFLWVRSEPDEPFTKGLRSFAPLIFLQLLFSMFFGNAFSVSSTWFWFGFLLALTYSVPAPSKPAAIIG